MSEQVKAHEHAHPSVKTYIAVGVVLTVITLVEVGVYYVPSFHPVLAPTLLVLSAAKFTLVVMFYMHLKADNKLFTFIFSLPLLIAASVAIVLLFLFGKFVL